MESTITSSSLLDTRVFQALDPLRLPPKLRDRVAKAQRRAAAEKQGVSLFASSTAASTLAHDTASPVDRPRGHRQSSLGNDDADDALALARDRAIGVGVGTGAVPEKQHLPDVVLGHKMREFEARMNLHSLLSDPLDTTLGRLTLDEKERVMLKMQRAIRAITSDVDALFLRLQREMDALGIFDAAANQLRAQTLCLVELEKRCRLDKIRDDAVREVLVENREGVLRDTGEKDPTRRMSSSRALLQMEGKLKHALSKRRQDAAGDGQQQQKHREQQQQQRAPLHLPRHEPIKRASASDAVSRRRLKRDAKSKSAQATRAAATTTSTTATTAAPVSNQSETTDVVNEVSPPVNHAIDSEASSLMARHPHIAQAIQFLASRSAPTTTTAASTATALSTAAAVAAQGDADAGDDPLHASTATLNVADEWSERSACYRTIAARSMHELQARHARWRWDSTAHFTSTPTSLSLSSAVLERVRMFHRPPDSDSHEDAGDAAMASTRESNADKQKRVAADYEQLQQRIRSRLEQLEALHATHALLPAIASRRARTAPTMMNHSASSSSLAPLDGLVPNAATGPRASTVDGTSRSRRSMQRPQSPSQQLVLERLAKGSVSAPVLPLFHSESHCHRDTPKDNQQEAVTTTWSDHRRSFLERKMPVLFNQQKRRSRHRESLIGAPVVADVVTLGHHSNARLEERRQSAQTWAWHHPSVRQPPLHRSPERLVEGDEEYDEEDDGDGFDMDEDDDRDDDDRSDGDDSGGDGEPRRRSKHSARPGAEDAASDADETWSTMSSSVWNPLETARSVRSVTSASNAPPNGPHRWSSATARRNGKKRTTRKSNTNLLGGLTVGANAANADALQHRLEELWRRLEFPFSSRLVMLERYADKQSDCDALQRGLSHWENAAEMVVVRERLGQALSEFSETKDVTADARLSNEDWAYLSTQHIEVPMPQQWASLSARAYVQWIQTQWDAITQRCEQLGQQLKSATGEELTFQGQRYPSRV